MCEVVCVCVCASPVNVCVCMYVRDECVCVDGARGSSAWPLFAAEFGERTALSCCGGQPVAFCPVSWSSPSINALYVTRHCVPFGVCALCVCLGRGF